MLLSIFASAADAPYVHKGTVRAEADGRPVDAVVRAWPDRQPTGVEGVCPKLGDEPNLYATRAKGGSYELHIKRDVSVFASTFCAEGYYAELVRAIPNLRNGPVNPEPVKLTSVDTTAAQYQELVLAGVTAALNNLSNLRRMRPDVFQDNVKIATERLRLPNELANAVLTLTAQVPKWGEPPVEKAAEKKIIEKQ
ncbi:hypothetical protein RA280_47400 [Cupriavidus sp. CV2]|uniref:hypothetical protein n=1 Tax=Cupriavidus ulmosensis TaxID=3065913 RepID=UPI00296B1EC9|nr:hypothetical protein [Cupriavidus sp. CV2]MDW3689210.1 hypothetical protein [Cupriavidus sp. CV2]